MNNDTFIVGLALLMILVLGVFKYIQSKKQAEIRKKLSGYPKGYFMNKGIGIGIAIGTGIGVAMKNIALGVGIGVAIGAAIGSSKEKKHKNEIRPITDEEKKINKQSIIFTFSVLFAGVLIFAIKYFITK